MTSKDRLGSDVSNIDGDFVRFWDRPPDQVAYELIGFDFCVEGVGGTIVETEAYSAADDTASHSFVGETRRNAVMFGPPGHAYIYRSYGLHWCLNFVCQRGSAVLLRALEPLHGIDRMISRRGLTQLRLLCSGPGQLAQALAVDGSHNEQPLTDKVFTFGRPSKPMAVVAVPRVGISKAIDKAWRFGHAGSAYLTEAIHFDRANHCLCNENRRRKTSNRGACSTAKPPLNDNRCHAQNKVRVGRPLRRLD